LAGSPQSSWHEWLRENLQGRDYLCLDPAESALGVPARLALYREGECVAWRFFGSLVATRAPHILIAGAARLLARAKSEVVVELPTYRPSPIARQTVHLLAELIQPESILIASTCEIDLAAWPVGPEVVELPVGFPPVVSQAQRRAQWLKHFEECEVHEVNLRQTTIEGARLGSGEALTESERIHAGLEGALHAEVCGSSLLAVSAAPLDEIMPGVLTYLHCLRAHVVKPDSYVDHVCSFAHEGGEDFGMGILRGVDFERGGARIVCSAVSPGPVRILRIGMLRVDSEGREVEESRPWEF
jgi:polynucleotide 5'-kinase involved in rRNA processing